MPKHACPQCGALYDGLGGGTCERCHDGPAYRNTGLIVFCAIGAAVILAIFVYLRLTH